MHYWGEPVNGEKSMETIHVQYKQAESGHLLPILVATTSITTLLNIVIVIMMIIIIMIVLTWCADQNWPQMVFLALPSAPINSTACSNFLWPQSTAQESKFAMLSCNILQMKTAISQAQ